MSESFPETTSPADLLNDALVGFTGCIGTAFTDICSYGLTVGDSYVPFDLDEDDDCDDVSEDGVICSQVWVRVDGVRVSSNESFTGDDCSIQQVIDLEVGILRCFETMEDGEAPTATQVLSAALQATTDMNTILCSALGCEVWESIKVGTWQPIGPLGGQHGGIWTFTVEV